MRILYFSQSFNPHDHRFLRALVAKGNEVSFLDLSSRRAGVPKGVRQVAWEGSLKQAIAKIKPEVIHAGPLPTCGYLAAKSGFRPLVVMSWGWDVLWSAQRSEQEKRRIVTALRNADAVITDCAPVSKQVIKMGVSRKKVVSFPWGVDLKKFHPGKGPNDLRRGLSWQDKFVVLHLRKLEKLYDPETAAKAFIRAAKANPDIRLIMPGSGGLGAKLKTLFQRNDLLELVYMPGSINQISLPDYYRAADLYLSCSKSDGSSVSLMEAMACGLPALVSHIPGNQEWVRAGKQGWLAGVKDDREFAEKILFAASGKKDLAKIGKAARKTAEKKADWNQNQKRLFRAYQVALNGTK
ncbi:MAG: glycosyltransferase family 4 protein [Anaerolineales bacterium]